MKDILYVKIEQNVLVRKRELCLEDVATLYSVNKSLVQTLNKLRFYVMKKGENSMVTFTIMKVYETIHKEYPNLEIVSLGEKDFIVNYVESEPNKWAQYGKTIGVCLILFFGAAFTIMTFDEDVNVAGVFEKIYRLLGAIAYEKYGVLEIAYSIGIPIGVLVFYNHFKKKNAVEDPTPIEIEMRNYEEQMNKAMIKNASREGKTIDVN